MGMQEQIVDSSPDEVPKDTVQRPAAAASPRRGLFRPATAEGRADCDTTGDDLARLVLVVVDTVRQLVEKQAIRRVDSGTLSEEEIERLGIALLRLEERMTELKEHFGLTDDDLALRLGGFQDLANETRHG
jgi:hypothetical protein